MVSLTFKRAKKIREQTMEGLRRRDLAVAAATGALVAGLATSMLKRPSLYDDNYQAKSLRQAIAAAFRNAPPRA